MIKGICEIDADRDHLSEIGADCGNDSMIEALCTVGLRYLRETERLRQLLHEHGILSGEDARIICESVRQPDSAKEVRREALESLQKVTRK